jgi:hypothetical protein
MAFRKDKTTAAQTAANVAGAVASAALTKGVVQHADEAAENAVVVFDALFERLGPVVEADNIVFAEAEGESAAKPAKSGGNRSTSGSRTRKTSGGGRKGGRGKVTLEDALSTELIYGAFEGVTLGNLVNISVDEAEESYGYGEGERDGRDYIAWLAGDTNENEYTQLRARLIADAEGIEY